MARLLYRLSTISICGEGKVKKIYSDGILSVSRKKFRKKGNK